VTVQYLEIDLGMCSQSPKPMRVILDWMRCHHSEFPKVAGPRSGAALNVIAS
jgi:hypothetical protein